MSCARLGAGGTQKCLAGGCSKTDTHIQSKMAQNPDPFRGCSYTCTYINTAYCTIYINLGEYLPSPPVNC